MTKVKLIRKDSLGIEGTVRNAKHHALKILPFIESMQGSVPHLGFKEWKQGHNVHQFTTLDGRSFTLRPVWTDEDSYVGIKLSARLSRSKEIPLLAICDVAEVPNLLNTMRAMAVPVPLRESAPKESL